MGNPISTRRPGPPRPRCRLIESAPIVADDWDRFPHRLLCTGNEQAGGPTVILEPFDWIDYGSWSVVQAQLSNQGYRVCANGYVEGESTPAQRAADLSEALTEAGISGPFVLVANGDGVHASPALCRRKVRRSRSGTGRPDAHRVPDLA